jgi:hypothetical protein
MTVFLQPNGFSTADCRVSRCEKPILDSGYSSRVSLLPKTSIAVLVQRKLTTDEAEEKVPQNEGVLRLK